jgi:hypothetical protein
MKISEKTNDKDQQKHKLNDDKEIIKESIKPDDSKKKLEPTHFGDWQVNCRTIDF